MLPFLEVVTRIYRLHILNGSNGRIHNLSLRNGAAFSIIGTDGDMLASIGFASSILLSAGERVDVLVDFSGLEIGTEVFLQSSDFQGRGYQGKQAFRIMKFSVGMMDSDTLIIPSVLSAYMPITDP